MPADERTLPRDAEVSAPPEPSPPAPEPEPGGLGVSRLNEVAFVFVWLFGNFLLRLLFLFRVENRPAITRDTPVIVCANHLSYLDPIVLQGALHRRVFYLMTSRFYDLPWARWFFRFCGAIPVRENGSQVASIRQGLKVLEARRVLGIFPEGGISRSGELGPGRPGVASLVLNARVPVIPAAILGTGRALPPGARMIRPTRLRVVFGAPMRFDHLAMDGDAAARRDVLRKVTEEIMARIASLQREHA